MTFQVEPTGMNIKHTPSPWKTKITDDGELWVIVGDHIEIYIGDLEETCGECHANARLMAIAPEMLKVCKKLAEFSCNKDCNSWKLADIIGAAEDVIGHLNG
jgi:hypothetical protein